MPDQPLKTASSAAKAYRFRNNPARVWRKAESSSCSWVKGYKLSVYHTFLVFFPIINIPRWIFIIKINIKMVNERIKKADSQETAFRV